MLVGLPAGGLSAHQLDEYLGLTLIGILRDRIQLFVSLTPGAKIVEPVLANIDRNRDERLSTDEQQRYADRIVTHLALAVDDVRPALRLIDVRFPTIEALRGGQGVIQLTLEAEIAPQRPGRHALFFANNNSDEISVYVVSVLKPSGPEVEIARQDRDWFQRQLRVEYDVSKGVLVPAQLWLVGATAAFLFAVVALVRTRFGVRRAPLAAEAPADTDSRRS